MADQEQVVMTPKCKTSNSTVLIIERRIVQRTNDKMHVAGGEHTGIVINKEATLGEKSIRFYKLTVGQLIFFMLQRMVLKIPLSYHYNLRCF